MANQVVKLVSSEGWASPTLHLFNECVDTAVGSAVTAVPGSNDTSLYSGTFVDVAAGRYRVVLMSGGKARAVDHVTLKDADGDYPVDGMRKPELVGDTIERTKVSASATQIRETISEVTS